MSASRALETVATAAVTAVATAAVTAALTVAALTGTPPDAGAETSRHSVPASPTAVLATSGPASGGSHPGPRQAVAGHLPEHRHSTSGVLRIAICHSIPALGVR